MTDTIILSGWLVVVVAIWVYLLRTYLRYEEQVEANEWYTSELEYFRDRELRIVQTGWDDGEAFHLDHDNRVEDFPRDAA